jgi:hypothetical protein
MVILRKKMRPPGIEPGSPATTKTLSLDLGWQPGILTSPQKFLKWNFFYTKSADNYNARNTLKN